MLIGLTGYRHSGENQVADLLVAKYGFVRMAFADPVYRTLVAVNPTIDGVALTDLVKDIGWRGIKDHETYGAELTRMLQETGKAVRTQFGANCCIESIRRRILSLPPGTGVVVTDTLLPNEAFFVDSLDGQLWRIEKEGTGPVNDDETEAPLPSLFVNETIRNEGPESLWEQVRRLMIETNTNEVNW